VYDNRTALWAPSSARVADPGTLVSCPTFIQQRTPAGHRMSQMCQHATWAGIPHYILHRKSLF
jgi:hypothetical protein